MTMIEDRLLHRVPPAGAPVGIALLVAFLAGMPYSKGFAAYFLLRLRRFEAVWAFRCRFSAFRFSSASRF